MQNSSKQLTQKCDKQEKASILKQSLALILNFSMSAPCYKKHATILNNVTSGLFSKRHKICKPWDQYSGLLQIQIQKFPAAF